MGVAHGEWDCGKFFFLAGGLQLGISLSKVKEGVNGDEIPVSIHCRSFAI